MGNVNITLANGQLGATLQTSDGVTGMVLTGTSTSGGYFAGTPILVTSLANLGAHAITAANNPFAYRQVKEFYDEAGIGAQLYLMLVPPTMNVHDMADASNPAGAKKLLDFAHGKIKVLGIMTDDDALTMSLGTPIATANGLNAEIPTAITRMAVLANQYFQAQKPFRAIIGGTSFSADSSELPDLTTGTSNSRTAVLIGNTTSGNGACLGLLLGRVAATPVMRKVSRVRTGALSNTAAWYSETPVESLLEQCPLIAAKGYITWTTYPNVSGYFFSGDSTCSATTDDYHFLARGRVIDKAHILAYTTFVQEVDDEVPVNTDGTLDAGFCKWLSQQIVNQVNNTMTANKEISSVECIIDPAQNILSTNQLNILLRIIPVGYATNIEISLGFDNPAL